MTDNYYTRPDVARAITEKLVAYGDIQWGDSILDPCVGHGAFANAFRNVTGVSVTTFDEDASVNPDVVGDFRRIPKMQNWNLISTNPPFSLWQKFVEISVGMLDPRGTVAFLLRLGVLGQSKKQKRAEFFEQFPITTIDVLRPRPIFHGKADNSEYGLFRWCPQDFGTGKVALGFLDWKRDIREPKTSRKSKAVTEAAAELAAE